MNAAIATVPPETLSESQRKALVSLLADDDRAVYQTVRGKVLSYGPTAGAWLRPHVLSSDPVMRRRAQEIISYLARQTADERFMRFCLNRGDDFDIEEGVWLLAQTQYPDFNVAAYQALFDSYAAELRGRIDFGGETEEILGAINRHLFHELGFHGNEQNYYEPSNSYLNRVVDQRTGNPISLCLVYLLVARRLRLPVTGIGLPGHFVCRFQTSTVEIFIDPFNQGKLLTKADCVKYLLHTQHGLAEGYLAPVSPRRMLLRMCANLHQIYLHHALPEETARLQRYLVALAR